MHRILFLRRRAAAGQCIGIPLTFHRSLISRTLTGWNNEATHPVWRKRRIFGTH